MSIKSKMTQKTLEKIEKTIHTKLTLGKLIWAIRKADEISQVDFADTLKISRQHLCDIERGRKSVRPRLAAKYADILGYSRKQFVRLSLQDLITRDGLHFEVEITVLKGRKKRQASHATT